MDGDSFLSMAAIPLLMFVVLAYYSFRLLVLHDTEAIRGKTNYKKLKNKDKYTEEAGKLMLFLAVGSLIMIGVLYFNIMASVVLICIWIVVFGILWKRMNDQYGEK
ncbi:MAG: hypothetical protein LUH07_07200 [Lachnospiraceae bacterium]|nr:hypothetical protein [Lachnospiraceae bacterium]